MSKALVILSDLTAELTANSRNVSEQFGLEFVQYAEENIEEKLINEEFQLALINPIIYANVYTKKELRILPKRIFGIKGWSNRIRLYIAQNSIDIKTIQISKNMRFVREVTKIVMSERFNIDVNFAETETAPNDFLLSNAFISSRQSGECDVTIDITDDWFDTFNFLLPVAFWVVPASNPDEKFLEIVEKCSAENKSGIEIIIENTNSIAYQPREGALHWDFDDEFERALDDTFEMLFYRNIVADMVDAKIFGRDYSTGVLSGV